MVRPNSILMFFQIPESRGTYNREPRKLLLSRKIIYERTNLSMKSPLFQFGRSAQNLVESEKQSSPVLCRCYVGRLSYLPRTQISLLSRKLQFLTSHTDAPTQLRQSQPSRSTCRRRKLWNSTAKGYLLCSLPTSQQQKPAREIVKIVFISGRGQQSSRRSRESKRFYILQWSDKFIRMSLSKKELLPWTATCREKS